MRCDATRTPFAVKAGTLRIRSVLLLLLPLGNNMSHTPLWHTEAGRQAGMRAVSLAHPVPSDIIDGLLQF